MLIEIEHLDFSYGSTPILQDVTLGIARGEFVGIMGPNGGGKTTLLRLLLGFLKPSKGKLTVKGSIGYVPQTAKTDRDFPITVLELILLGAVSKTNVWGSYPNAFRQEAYEWIERLGLTPHQHKPFGALSGGLAQRALLARALLSHPELLLLDEPTANIDAASVTLIMNLLQSLKPQKTILLVTHDLKTAVERVDRVLCVQGTVSSYLPANVCEHFALGLYHTPLLGLPPNHFEQKEAHVLNVL